MEEILEAQGELRSFRLYQRQPAHRDRSIEQQLWGFMWNRKAEYARLLVEALDSDRMPRPLDRASRTFCPEAETQEPPLGKTA